MAELHPVRVDYIYQNQELNVISDLLEYQRLFNGINNQIMFEREQALLLLKQSIYSNTISRGFPTSALSHHRLKFECERMEVYVAITEHHVY